MAYKYCSVLCSHSEPEALTITLVRGKLTLLEIKDRPYRHQNNYGLISKDFYTHTACTVGVDL